MRSLRPLLAAGGPRRERPRGAGRGLHLALQLVGQIGQTIGKVGGRLGDEIDCADFKRLERGFGATLRQRRNHHHRHRPQRHDLAQERQPVHVRHLDVERDDVGIERLDALARDMRIAAVPTTSISGSSASNLASSCRITAESSTIRTRTGRASDCIIRSPNSWMSPAAVVRSSRLLVVVLFAIDRESLADSEQPAHHPSGRRVVVNAPRQRSAEVLRGAPQAFGLQIAQHEFGIVGADRVAACR